MARDKRYRWKEFYITSFDDMDWLDSAWQSSWDAFGPGRVFDVDNGSGWVRTNLSLRDCRSLFRHAGVRWYDYVSVQDVAKATDTKEGLIDDLRK